MRTNVAKKIATVDEVRSSIKTPKINVKLVEKFESSQYDELSSIDYEAFLMQYGVRSDFA